MYDLVASMMAKVIDSHLKYVYFDSWILDIEDLPLYEKVCGFRSNTLDT